MSKKDNKDSPWQPLFFRVSDRDSICGLCNKVIPKGSMIFYFPKLKKGIVYCYKCFPEKVDTIAVVQSL